MIIMLFGGLAQLARAPALHAGGRGFESHILHQLTLTPYLRSFFVYKIINFFDK